MNVRPATSLDRENIRGVHLSAFPEGEGEIVAKLAVDLLSEETTPPTLSLVAEAQGNVVGHVAFSPVTIANDPGFCGYILAPLGVKPDYQKRRIGARLVDTGIHPLSTMGIDRLFVYGDPAYYGRFGFNAEAAARYIPAYNLKYPFGWLGIALNQYVEEGGPVTITCVPALCDPALW